MISINILHCVHSKIDCLCIPHHLAGVAFNTNSKEYSRYDSISFASNSTRKDKKLGKPSYVVSSISSAPTHHTELVIIVHIRMDISCSRLCQFSNASPKSNMQDLTLHQLSFPSAVGFI